MNPGFKSGALGASCLVLAYTLLITLADAMTKHLAKSFEAPQVLMICSGLVCILSLLHLGATPKARVLKTSCPRAMARRSGMTVIASVCFYYAFALLPFAEVFLFIAMVPIFSGLMSAPILGERVSAVTWVALASGSFGVYLLFPSGLASVEIGHVIALVASLSGTLAIVLARYMGRIEARPLAQVFYPQASVFFVMLFAAPFFWTPMSVQDVALALACGLSLFAARYMLAVALQELPAYTVTPLLNLQFVWMVLIGFIAFAEIPAMNTVLGALVIVAASVFLVNEQRLRELRSTSRINLTLDPQPSSVLRNRA